MAANPQWLTINPIAISGTQNDLPKNPEKLMPKFDPNDDILPKTHLGKFMLAMNIMNVQHEDVACRFFYLTLQGKASSWFFNLPSRSITSWQQFENAFIMQFGDDKTSGTLLLELARLKINENEKVKDFNQRFITLLNKIPDKSS